MTHTSCCRCGAQVAQWNAHDDNDEWVCPDCCTNPACRRTSVTDELVDHLAGIVLTRTPHGTNVRRRTDDPRDGIPLKRFWS